MFTSDDDVKIESDLKAIDNYFECGNYDEAHKKLSDTIKFRRVNKITNATLDLQLKVRRINSTQYLTTFLSFVSSS